jgi:hypothetical protein
MRRFDEAEALLLRVAGARPWARADLAWLHELRGDRARSLELVEAHLRDQPDDARVRAQRDRLRARGLSPEQLAGEVEALAALGEQVPDHLFAEYVEGLLREGRGADARAQLLARAPALATAAARTLAWKTYKLQAYDVAFELFAAALDDSVDDDKHLAALEASARRAGRVPELVELYRRAAPRRPSLHGRIRRLSRP